MIIGKKKENVITAEKENADYACPMLDFIARLIAIDMEESDAFRCDSPHTLLLYDLVIKLYEREECKEAMEALAVAFLIAGMEDTSQLIAVASAGYTDTNAGFFLDRLFYYSDLPAIYELGREIYEDEEVS